MKLSIIVNPVMGGWSPWSVRLGGTEESVVEWATRLKARGHDVEVFHNGDHGVYAGVPYRERIDYLKRAGDGLTLNCNYPDLATQEPTVYFNNLTHAASLDLSRFAAVIHPSRWACNNLDVKHDQQYVVPHGYDPKTIYREPKIPNTVLYASSPDRGLTELIPVWREVVREVPHSQLIVTYNGQLDLPNVICLGNVDSETMAELYRTSDIWCHPCLGGELFGMTGVKAQVAGCWPVYYPTMALTETVTYGTKTDRAHLAADLIAALQNHPEPPAVELADWEDSTTQLEKVLQSFYN